MINLKTLVQIFQDVQTVTYSFNRECPSVFYDHADVPQFL